MNQLLQNGSKLKEYGIKKDNFIVPIKDGNLTWADYGRLLDLSIQLWGCCKRGDTHRTLDIDNVNIHDFGYKNKSVRWGMSEKQVHQIHPD